MQGGITMGKNTLRVAVPQGKYEQKVRGIVESVGRGNFRCRRPGELPGDVRRGANITIKAIAAPLLEIPSVVRQGKADMGVTQEFALANDPGGLFNLFRLK